MRFAALLPLLLLAAACGGSSSDSSSNTPLTPGVTPSNPCSAALHQWKSEPKMVINATRNYTATFQSTDGSFVVRLEPKVAPITVNNFIFLAEHHFYDHVLFHRIIQPFMIQTGDETGTGLCGPGYTIKDEKVRQKYTPGTLAMANTGQPNSGGSQFFIVTGPEASSLPPSYTIFGKVVRGMNVVHKIAATPVTQDPANPTEVSHPLKDIYIEHITIH